MFIDQSKQQARPLQRFDPSSPSADATASVNGTGPETTPSGSQMSQSLTTVDDTHLSTDLTGSNGNDEAFGSASSQLHAFGDDVFLEEAASDAELETCPAVHRRGETNVPDQEVNNGLNGYDFDARFLWSDPNVMADHYLSDVFSSMDHQPGPITNSDNLLHDNPNHEIDGVDVESACREPGSGQQISPLVAGNDPHAPLTPPPPLPMTATRQTLQQASEQTGSEVSNAHGLHQPGVSWTVSSEAYERLSREIVRLARILPENFNLPKRQNLSRYLAGYIRGFHPHLPFLHLPTTSSDTISPVLLMALCAVGAFYGFERPQGYELYFASRAITEEHFEQHRRESMHHLMGHHSRHENLSGGLPRETSAVLNLAAANPVSSAKRKSLEIIQSLVVLTQLTSWVDSALVRDAIVTASQLSVLVREELNKSQPLEIDMKLATAWHDWWQDEGRRRTLYAAYVVVNLQTISFNIPPAIPNMEIRMLLPSSAAEWNAAGSGTWRDAVERSGLQRNDFQHCLKRLFSGHPVDKEVSTSSFANYVLIQGILQYLYFERQAALGMVNSALSLPPGVIDPYAQALRTWEADWNKSRESTLDPASPYGPLGFNSTAMLRLAHIRLSVGLGDESSLMRRDPQVLARAFVSEENPVPVQPAHLEQAISQCIDAFRIPVRVGIPLVARTQTGHWSVQHALASFACALMLTRWLENMSCFAEEFGPESLGENEKHLLNTISSLIEETHYAGSLGTKESDALRIHRLRVIIVQVWAEAYQGVQVFEIVETIGTTFSLVAQILEDRLKV